MNNPGKPTILFVCTANIIRSPTAEALLKDKIRRYPPLAGWKVASAGVYGLTDEPADPTTQAVMKSRGYDLSRHVARKVSAHLVAQSDLVITMEKGQKEILLSAYPDQKVKIRFIGDIAGTGEDVFDPIGGARETYESAIENIRKLIDQSFFWIIVLAKYYHDIWWCSEDVEPLIMQVPMSVKAADFTKNVMEILVDIPPIIRYRILYLLLQIVPGADILQPELESLSQAVPPTREEENWLIRMRLFEIVRPVSCLQQLREEKYRHPDIQKKITPMIGRLENPTNKQLFYDLEQLYARNLPAFKYRLGIWDLKTKYPNLPYRVGDYEEAYTILNK